MATKRKKQEYNPEPRVLFNWGFHDGANEFRLHGGPWSGRAEGWRERTPVYAAGHEYGQEFARSGRYDFERGTLSSEAWLEYIASSAAPDEYVDAVEEANAICDLLEREKEIKK